MATPPKSIAIRLCLLILAVIGLFIGAWHFITRDIAPFDDSDLALPERVIDPAQNPIPMIRELEISEERLENLKQVNLMIQQKQPVDAAFVDSVIKDFAEESALFDQYAVMTDWKLEGEISISSLFPEIQVFLKIGMLKQAEIRRNLDRGEISIAVQKTILLMHLGERMKNADGALLHYLVGSAIVGIAQRLLLEIIDRRKLNPEALELLAKEIDQIQVSNGGLVNAFKIEYQIFIPVIEDLADGKIDIGHISNGGSSVPGNPRRPNRFIFKENRTKSLYAEACRDFIREAPMPRKEAPKKGSKRIGEIRDNRVKMWLSGNVVGQILVLMSIPAFDGVIDRDAIYRASHQLIRLRIAMERYRLSKGAWPPDLDSLVPEFIDSIPIDPMGGAPMRYNHSALKIYSVGLDFIDDNGEADRPGLLKGRNELVIELEPESTIEHSVK